MPYFIEHKFGYWGRLRRKLKSREHLIHEMLGSTVEINCLSQIGDLVQIDRAESLRQFADIAQVNNATMIRLKACV